jgi:hypothetical protein
MSQQTQRAPRQREQAPQQTESATGIFLYAVVPSDVEPTEDAEGIGHGAVSTVTHQDIAALVTEVGLDRPLGKPEELRTYQQLLDGTAVVAPVLPVRFGAVLTDADAVADLLATYHDEFAAALGELEGLVEYAVRGRYVEQALLTEVLAENSQIQQMRDQVRSQPEELTVNLRMRLGELVNQAVEAKRNADTQRVVDALAPLSEQVVVRPASHEEDAANIALLVETERREEFEDAVRQLAEEWADRVTLRLLGPLAPYDFVASLDPGA